MTLIVQGFMSPPTQYRLIYKIANLRKRLRLSSKHAGAKRNLTQNQDSKSIKVTCLESVEKQ